MQSRSGPFKSPAPLGRREIKFVKKGHTYSFGYQSGSELSLICALLGMAIDEQYNLDLDDARKLIDTLGLSAPSASNFPPNSF